MRHWRLAMVLAVGLASAAHAEMIRYQWNGSGDGNWSSAANWTQLDGTVSGSGVPLVQNPGVQVPGATDTFTQLQGSGTRSITVDGQFTINKLQVEWTRWETNNSPYGWREDGVWRDEFGTSYTDIILTGSTPNARLTIANSLVLGWGGANGGTQANYERVHGSLTANDVDLVVGSPASRASIWLGNHLSRGTLTVNGGSFEGYLTDLVIGAHSSVGGGGVGAGTMDLSLASSVNLDVSGSVYLASSDLTYGSFRSGTLKIANGTAHVAGNLYLGYITAGETSSTTSHDPYKWGNLYLTNSIFTVDGRAFFGGRQGQQGWEYNQARIFVTLDGIGGGLDLANSNANALTFKFPVGDAQGREHNKISITFADDPDLDDYIFGTFWYWGLRWAGDHEVYLEGLLNESQQRLVINDSGLSDAYRRSSPEDYILYDPLTNYTYIGFQFTVVPEPSTLAVGLLGLVVCRLRRARARRRKA